MPMAAARFNERANVNLTRDTFTNRPEGITNFRGLNMTRIFKRWNKPCDGFPTATDFKGPPLFDLA